MSTYRRLIESIRSGGTCAVAIALILLTARVPLHAESQGKPDDKPQQADAKPQQPAPETPAPADPQSAAAQSTGAQAAGGPPPADPAAAPGDGFRLGPLEGKSEIELGYRWVTGAGNRDMYRSMSRPG